MEVQRRVGREGLEKILEESEVKGLDPALRKLHAIDQIGPAAEIHADLGQGLVQRDQRPSEPAHPLLRPERLLQRVADDDADILDRVMVIDLCISLGLNREIEEPVLRQEGQHVVQEGERGLDLAPAGSIQRQVNLHRRFGGGPFDGGLAIGFCGLHTCRLSTDLACASSPSMCAIRERWSLTLTSSSLL